MSVPASEVVVVEDSEDGDYVAIYVNGKLHKTCEGYEVPSVIAPILGFSLVRAVLFDADEEFNPPKTVDGLAARRS